MTNKVVFFVLIVLVGGYMALPLGLRNKNPLNIKFSAANNWDGQTGKRGAFAVFSSSKYGIRAGAKLLRNYQARYQLDTIQKLINRWAPDTENKTDSYIEHVATYMQMSPAEYLNLNDDGELIRLITVMIKHENGMNPFSQDDIAAAVALV